MNNELPPGLQAAPRPLSRHRGLKRQSREPAVTNQDYVNALAHAFSEGQRRPLIVNTSVFDSGELSEEQVKKLSQYQSKHPEQARAAMDVYRAVRSGELVPIDN